MPDGLNQPPPEEEELARMVLRAQQGDEVALEGVCRGYERRVASIARSTARHFGATDLLEDLRGWGFVGLIEAVRGFDPERGSFWAFARKHVAGRMRDFLEREIGWRKQRVQDEDTDPWGQQGGVAEPAEGAEKWDVGDVNSAKFVVLLILREEEHGWREIAEMLGPQPGQLDWDWNVTVPEAYPNVCRAWPALRDWEWCRQLFREPPPELSEAALRQFFSRQRRLLARRWSAE